MRRRLVVMCGLTGALLLGCDRQPEQAAAVANPAYRTELLSRVARDQAVRDNFAEHLRATGEVSPSVVQSMMAVDSENVSWLKERVRVGGLPSRQEVGADGVRAALLLIQHADRDTEWQAAMLPAVEAAFRDGDIAGQELAMLTDRVAKAQGQPQRFGTQATISGGTVRFDPIADSAQVDARRATLGLVPLAEYKRSLDSLYAKPSPVSDTI